MPMKRRDLLKYALSASALPMMMGPYSANAAPHNELRSTTAMIRDILSHLGGEHVATGSMMGPGIDPHSYRATRNDIVALQKAKVIFYNGLSLEVQLEPLLSKLAKHKPVIAVTDRLDRGKLRAHPTYKDKYDPHVWMSPELWREVAAYCAEVLRELRPDLADEIANNYESYAQELGALHRYAAERLATIPEKSRVLVTAHDAFGYFGAAYHIDVMGIQGLSTASEAGLHRIAELVGEIVARDIKAVFVESSVSERNLRALIEGAGARGHQVQIGGQLYSDAMGPEGSYEGTYIGMIDHNVTTIARALGGDAPLRGMNGKLKVLG